MSSNDILNASVELIERLHRDKLAAVTALETREHALAQIVQEYEERIAELKPELARREDFDKLVQRARKFADS
jgi:hypothetical protein